MVFTAGECGVRCHGNVNMTAATVKIVLDIREGSGFEFVKQPIIISCSLENDVIETHPIQCKNSSAFETKLIWNIDNKTFQRLIIRDTPLKVNIINSSTKKIIAYLNISLLNTKINDGTKLKYTWHKLSGSKFVGKSLRPRLLLCLILEEDSNLSEPKKNTDSNLKNKPINVPNSDIMTIKIGDDHQCIENFMLSFNITDSQNMKMLLPTSCNEDISEKYNINFIAFSKVITMKNKQKKCIFIKSSILRMLEYFNSNPYAIFRYSSDDQDFGIGYFDLRKIVPTNNTSDFLIDFCDSSEAYTIKERCYFVNTTSGYIPNDSDKNKPFIGLEIILKFINVNNMSNDNLENSLVSDNLIPNELTIEPPTEYLEEQVKAIPETNHCKSKLENSPEIGSEFLISPRTKEKSILKFVNELEDWKEHQQELFKVELKQKETYHMNELNIEWNTRRDEYEQELIQNMEYCYKLIANLSEIINSLKLREIQIDNKEKNVCSAKHELEMVYRLKYQEIMDASKKMELDFNHQLRLHKVKYTQLVNEVKLLSQENALLKETLNGRN